MTDLDFSTFAQLLVDTLGVTDVCDLRPDSGLFDDLGLDSFQALEMLLIIEATADVDMPPSELPEMLTLGDAYDYYRTVCALAATGPHP